MYEGISSVNLNLFATLKQNQILLLAGYTEGVWQKKKHLSFSSVSFFHILELSGTVMIKILFP